MSELPDWTALEVRHLLALVAVIEEGSFGAAAARLGYSQPGISHQIAALERIVGRPLVVRRSSAGRVVPTRAGRLLVPYALGMIADSRRAGRELALLGQREADTGRALPAAGACAGRLTERESPREDD